MSYLEIQGGKRLHGELMIHGAKNSVLPLLAAAYMCEGQTVLHNCPLLSDVKVSLEILKHLGCKCEWQGKSVIVNSSNSGVFEIPENLMREMRSSIVFLGAVAAKLGKSRMCLPGGCELGPRPIDIHIESLEKLGAEIECSSGYLDCLFNNGVKGAVLNLRFPSVGATENIILAATLGNGTTVIHNAAKEPEIVDLAMFLNSAGAKITGAGSDTVIIEGVKRLSGVEYTVMPDRIIAATCMLATAACNGKVHLINAVPLHIAPVISVLKDGGCEVNMCDGGLTVTSHIRQRNFNTVSTQPYPGFPTDAGPILVAMSSVSRGTGVFVENIFNRRFHYVDELKRLGADIKTVGRVAVITGVKALDGAEVVSHDLRGGAALTVAALAAKGKSVVRKPCYIDRGYERIEDIFGALGAEIKRIEE